MFAPERFFFFDGGRLPPTIRSELSTRLSRDVVLRAEISRNRPPTGSSYNREVPVGSIHEPNNGFDLPVFPDTLCMGLWNGPYPTTCAHGS